VKVFASYAKTSAIPAMTGFVERFNPALFPILTAIDNNEKICHILSLRHSPNRPGADPVAWDLAIHDTDWIISALTTGPNQIRGRGRINTDTALITIELPDNATYIGSASRLAHSKVRTWMISTDQADYHIDLVTQSCYRYTNDRSTIVEVTQNEPLKLQWDFFTKIVEGKRSVDASDLLGVASHQFIAQVSS
jgi:predicted dehydrogenase